ncbi:MAG: TIGR03084 family metal-binding protein [Nocardioides sp.]|uniref:TIGR03084 family metal-binding protein n=1 Tax=Nocardioides sp. TaxID=35761 RepID=UPI0039E2A2BD
MSDLLDGILADLAAEGDRLDHLVAGLPEAQWRLPTPAPGWDIATQVAHLAWTDEAAGKAATDKVAWDELVLAAMANPDRIVDEAALTGGAAPPTELLTRWRRARASLALALRAMPEGERLPWFGPPMSPASMATARFMETWAHGLDIYEALGLEPEVTDRIRQVAHLGVRTRDFAFRTRGLTPPADQFRIELIAPFGATWTWGPVDAPQRVTGSAYDFCRLVTQRRHRADTDLLASGADADRWLDIAQAFAGPPGEGRRPT